MSTNASGPWQFVPARDQRDLTVRASAPTMPQPGHDREAPGAHLPRTGAPGGLATTSTADRKTCPVIDKQEAARE
ncbi:hypothetical protein ACIOML_29270 [Streptomyces anulatus]